MEKISIIVPVYNVAPYLEKCLESMMAQTYQNIEIICVDDGSTDVSGEILDTMAKKDSRIIALHQENKGTGAARNLALEHATGEYIGFVDADDWIEPDMYEGLYNAMAEQKVDIVTCGYFIEEGNSSRQVLNQKKVREGKLKTAEFLEYIYRRDCYKGVSGYLWTRLFRAELFQKTAQWEAVKFQPDLKVGQDVAVIADCCVRAKTMLYLPNPYYHYVQREDSAVHDKQRMMQGKTSCEAYDYIISIFEKHGVSSKIVRLVKRFFVYHASVRYRYAVEVNNAQKAEEARELMKKYLRDYIIMNLRYPSRIWHILKLLWK